MRDLNPFLLVLNREKVVFAYVDENRRPICPLNVEDLKFLGEVLTPLMETKKVLNHGGDLISDVEHDPDESCQTCGSYLHNTWSCRYL